MAAIKLENLNAKEIRLNGHSVEIWLNEPVTVTFSRYNEGDKRIVSRIKIIPPATYEGLSEEIELGPRQIKSIYHSFIFGVGERAKYLGIDKSCIKPKDNTNPQELVIN